ncbi:hypothetical protein KVR01_008922 [Diaporthe batatas]|uniref:uncharacterized protein n=1 Tax=Diaporthe batatas TaxID=748121 RepID=UPI001D05B70C|nr:uncharacterized protein KVR01_008922 [Diaporthe batatas]KAG8160658.1 hypothetical protein KVR01_008922 [Diaporthe batatas]
MKAVVISSVSQGNEKHTSLSLEERPQPTPQPGQLVVKVAVSPLQPSDLLNTQGNFPLTTFPRIPGRDFAGTVVAPADSNWHGKTVAGTSGPVLGFTRDGAHAEFVVVDEEGVVEVPDDLDVKRVGLLGTPWTTAYLALSRASPVQNDTVLVLGASGQVGNAVSQLVKSSLFSCRLLTAGRGDRYDVDSAADPSLATVLNSTDGRGPDIVVDTTGDIALQAAGIRNLSVGGRLSRSPNNRGTSAEVDFKELYRKEQIIIGTNSVSHDVKSMAGILRKLLPLFKSGELQLPDISQNSEIQLDGAVGAYEEMARGSRKKFVIVNS